MSTTTATVELQSIALADIGIQPDHNARRHFDRTKLNELASSIKANGGVSTPIRVRRNGDDEGPAFWLVAGERRYRAALLAGEDRVEAVVKPADAADSDMEDAILENLLHEDLDPIEEAHAYVMLMERKGLNRRAAAKRLGRSQKLITERVQALELPQELHEHVAGGAIPLSAIKPLRTLAAVRPDIAVLTAKFLMMDQGRFAAYRKRTWPDLVAAPIDAACAAFECLPKDRPDELYETFTPYPLSRFDLTEKVTKDLQKLKKLRPNAGKTVTFNSQSIEAARRLGAALLSESHNANGLILGKDVASQIAGDTIAADLKYARKVDRERKADAEAAAQALGRQPGEGPGDPSTTAAVRAEAERRAEVERLQAEREERRRLAVAYNEELAAAVIKRFVRVKLDLNVIKILAALPFGDMLDRIVMRGARYGYPGFTDVVTIDEKEQTVYAGAGGCLETIQAQLAGIKAPGDFAGRLIQLVVMARYANEDAVHETERARWTLSFPDGLGVSEELIDAIDALAAERLPDHLTAAKRAERAEQQEFEALLKSVRSRWEQMDDAAVVEAMTAADCEQLRQDIIRAFPVWTEEAEDMMVFLANLQARILEEEADADERSEHDGEPAERVPEGDQEPEVEQNDDAEQGDGSEPVVEDGQASEVEQGEQGTAADAGVTEPAYA